MSLRVKSLSKALTASRSSFRNLFKSASKSSYTGSFSSFSSFTDLPRITRNDSLPSLTDLPPAPETRKLMKKFTADGITVACLNHFPEKIPECNAVVIQGRRFFSEANVAELDAWLINADQKIIKIVVIDPADREIVRSYMPRPMLDKISIVMKNDDLYSCELEYNAKEYKYYNVLFRTRISGSDVRVTVWRYLA